MLGLAEGQAPDKAVVLLTSATLPLVVAIEIVPTTSGEGRLELPLPASWTRKYFPGTSKQGPVGQRGVTVQGSVPLAELY